MINGIIVQNNPLKYIDPRGLQTENTPTYQEQTVGESVTRESYFVDEYDNKNYLDVGYNSGNNISLSSGNQEAPGLANYGPTYDDIGQGVSTSNGLANKIFREAVSWAPVIGPGIDSYRNFKDGDYVKGFIYAGLAVSDVVPIAAGITRGFKAATRGIRGLSKLFKAGAKEPKRVYSARELIRRSENPRINNFANPNHNFPESFNAEIFKGTKTIVTDKYHLYTAPGTVNRRSGTFEIGVRPSESGMFEVITHRFFNPSKK